MQNFVRAFTRYILFDAQILSNHIIILYIDRNNYKEGEKCAIIMQQDVAPTAPLLFRVLFSLYVSSFNITSGPPTNPCMQAN